MVLNPGKEALAKAIFDKYDLDAEVIGETTDTGHLVLTQFGKVVCDIPVAPLGEDAPNYDRPWVEPPKRAALDLSKHPELDDYGAVLMKLMSSPDMASKRWVWEQYDRHVMGDTVDSSQSMGDAAIVRVHGTQKALAICSDCNPHYVAADPFEGGKAVVAEAYRNLSAVGAEPIAITDNLNFGNPEKPNTMGYIVKAIEGMAEACRQLEFPVVSGNVSLYNETDGKAIPPTPVVGGVGLIKDVSKVATLKGAQPGDAVILIGETKGHLGASLYARVWLGLKGDALGPPPPVDLQKIRTACDFVRGLVQTGRVHGIHDVSEGGVFCAVAELALQSAKGISLWTDVLEAPLTGMEQADVAALFGEDQGCFVCTVAQGDANATLTAAAKAGVPAVKCGAVNQDVAALVLGEKDIHLNLPLASLRDAHEGWMPSYMNSVN